MAEFDFSSLLAVEKAKIRVRGRLNFLGSKELTLEYFQIAEPLKEKAVAWLDANRTSLVNPALNHKTLTGTWYCVSITYNESSKSLVQRFKIDAGLVSNDSFLSKTERADRSYYWRIVDPDSINIPASTTAGTTYVKTATENSDGTYDVTIVKTESITTAIEAFYARVSATTSTTEVVYNHTSSAAIVTPTPTAGVTVDQSATENADGSYNVRIRTTTESEYDGESRNENAYEIQYTTTTINDAEITVDDDYIEALFTTYGFDFSEISPDVTFDDDGVWTAASCAVAGGLLTFSGSGTLRGTGISMDAGYYRVVYTITANPSSHDFNFQGTAIPSTVGTHDVIVRTSDVSNGLEVSAAGAGVVVSQLSVKNYYGYLSALSGYWTTTSIVPLGYTFRVENLPLENGKFRTQLLVRQAKQNIRFDTILNTTGGVAFINIRNATVAFMSAIVDLTQTTPTLSSLSRAPSITLNEFGLLDAVVQGTYD